MLLLEWLVGVEVECLGWGLHASGLLLRARPQAPGHRDLQVWHAANTTRESERSSAIKLLLLAGEFYSCRHALLPCYRCVWAQSPLVSEETGDFQLVGCDRHSASRQSRSVAILDFLNSPFPFDCSGLLGSGKCCSVIISCGCGCGPGGCGRPPAPGALRSPHWAGPGLNFSPA